VATPTFYTAAENTAAFSLTTVSLSVASGDLVILPCYVQGGSTPQQLVSTLTIDDTGADLDWHLLDIIDRANGSNLDYPNAIAVFYAVANGTSFVATLTKSGEAWAGAGIKPVSISGYNTGTPFAPVLKAIAGVSTGTYAPNLPNAPSSTSIVLSFFSGTADSGSIDVTENSTTDPWTERYDSPLDNYYSRHMQSRTGSTATTVSYANIAASGGGYYHTPIVFAVEVKAASTGNTLTASAGSYALTGQVAGLNAGHIQVAAQGSYALTGQAAALTKSAVNVLTADFGAYTLLGSDALVDLSLLCAQGSYALTGQSAGLLSARTLTAAQGSYGLTGISAFLTWSGAPVVAGVGNWIPIKFAARLERLKHLSYSQLYADAVIEASANRQWASTNAYGKIRVRVDSVPIPLP
jgi:hypothetical protein